MNMCTHIFLCTHMNTGMHYTHAHGHGAHICTHVFPLTCVPGQSLVSRALDTLPYPRVCPVLWRLLKRGTSDLESVRGRRAERRDKCDRGRNSMCGGLAMFPGWAVAAAASGSGQCCVQGSCWTESRHKQWPAWAQGPGDKGIKHWGVESDLVLVWTAACEGLRALGRSGQPPVARRGRLSSWTEVTGRERVAEETGMLRAPSPGFGGHWSLGTPHLGYPRHPCGDRSRFLTLSVLVSGPWGKRRGKRINQ